MNTQARIASILKTQCLDTSITGFPTFDLTALELTTDLNFALPKNFRLGHLAEKIVSELIQASSNFKVLYENVQILEGKNTIGEIDFIIEDIPSEQIIHLELAYKFYLFDPSISSKPINNWIGPNRNDSLKDKLKKLKEKQFPLLHHHSAKSAFSGISTDNVSQALCLLVTLFIPYKYKGSFNPAYERAIKGYYLNFETFTSLDDSAKRYYFPPKKEWGMEPSENDKWSDYSDVRDHIMTCMKEKQAPLCWQKQDDSHIAFFIVWW